jgi:hypothetical protein
MITQDELVDRVSVGCDLSVDPDLRACVKRFRSVGVESVRLTGDDYA